LTNFVAEDVTYEQDFLRLFSQNFGEKRTLFSICFLLR